MSSQKSSFVPPSFGKFGKNTKDLFKKKYDFEHSLKTVNRSSTGLVLESGAVLTDASTLRGYVKVNLPTSQGEFATELYTDAAQDSRANYRFTKLAKGVSANVVFSTKDKDRAFKNSVGALELEYSQDNLATTLTAKSDANVTKLDASATVGTDGLSVGAQAVVDASAGFAVNDYNFGAEYAQNDYTVSLSTEKSASFVTASYFQRVSPAQSLGASFRYEMAGKNDRSLTVGSEYRVDADTTVKSKLELPTGDLSTHIEHRLANPRALVGIASTFNVNSTKLQAQKFGFSVSLGDF